MQLDPAVAKTRPSNFSPVVLRMFGFTSSDADPATAKKTGNCAPLSPHSKPTDKFCCRFGRHYK